MPTYDATVRSDHLKVLYTRACTYIGPGAQYILMRSTDTSLRTLSHEFTHIIQGGYDIRAAGSGTAMGEAVASVTVTLRASKR